MNYQDLIGRSWSAMDCRAASVEALRRLGYAGAARALEGLEGPPVDAPLVRVGSTVAAAKVGDVIYTAPRDGRPASVGVVISVEQGRAITSTHDHGVGLVRLSGFCEPLSVWRPIG